MKRQRFDVPPTGGKKRKTEGFVPFKAKTASAPMVGIGAELKFNTAAFGTDATTTPTIVPLTTFAAGDTVLLRDANKILAKSIDVRAHFTNEGAASGIIRLVVVLDKNANQSSPAWLDVFDSATVESQRLINNLSRFTILADDIIEMNLMQAAGVNHLYHRYIKIAKELQMISFADGTSAVPVSNSLTLMYISNVVAGAADFDVAGNARLRFVG